MNTFEKFNTGLASAIFSGKYAPTPKQSIINTNTPAPVKTEPVVAEKDDFARQQNSSAEDSLNNIMDCIKTSIPDYQERYKQKNGEEIKVEDLIKHCIDNSNAFEEVLNWIRAMFKSATNEDIYAIYNINDSKPAADLIKALISNSMSNTNLFMTYPTK